MEYLELNHLLSDDQFGFRCGRSTIGIQFYVFLTNYLFILKAMNNFVTFLYLSKAFDCIVYDITCQACKIRL